MRIPPVQHETSQAHVRWRHFLSPGQMKTFLSNQSHDLSVYCTVKSTYSLLLTCTNELLVHTQILSSNQSQVIPEILHSTDITLGSGCASRLSSHAAELTVTLELHKGTNRLQTDLRQSGKTAEDQNCHAELISLFMSSLRHQSSYRQTGGFVHSIFKLYTHLVLSLSNLMYATTCVFVCVTDYAGDKGYVSE